MAYDIVTELKHRIEELEARLDAIANYADPDFPLETVEAEARRAWRIIYTLKAIASEETGKRQ
jgi:hypothetical protein